MLIVHLLWAYLERGWESEYDWRGARPSFEAVVRHFKAISPPELVSRAASEMRCLLAQPLSERLLSEIVAHDFCVAFDPSAANLSYRQWLEAVAAILAEPQEKAKALPTSFDPAFKAR